MRRSVVVSVFVALALSLGSVAPVAAGTLPGLSASDSSALTTLLSQPGDQVTVIIYKSALPYLTAHDYPKVRYLGFGYSSLRIDKSDAANLLSNTTDGSIKINRVYTPSELTPSSRGSDLYPYNSSYVSDPSDIINSLQVNQAGYRGAGQSIAILDTGIDDAHPFFLNSAGDASRIVAQACYVSMAGQPAPCLNGLYEDHSAHAANVNGFSGSTLSALEHGTHVAGIAAGNADSFTPSSSYVKNGIAPDANIIPIRVFGGDNASDEDILAALSWVYSHAEEYKIASVNLSLGSYPDHTCNQSTIGSTYPDYQGVFTSLSNVGVAPVVATGNDGSGQNSGAWHPTNNPYGLGIAAPACINPAISIGSTDNDDKISSFSNMDYGIDLVAPGSWVWSAIPRNTGYTWATMSGTSMATPVVAGAWALMREANPTISVSDALNLLRATGTLVDDTIVQDIPRIDIQAALSASASLGKPQNVSATWTDFENAIVTWSAPTFGPTPTGYLVTVGAVQYTTGASARSYSVPIYQADTFISVSSLNGSDTSSATAVLVMPQSVSVNPVKKPLSNVIASTNLGGDFCLSGAPSPTLTLRYDGPTTGSGRKIWLLDGLGNATSFTETKLTTIPSGLTNGYARQIVIPDPLNNVLSTSKLYFANSAGMVGPEWNLSTISSELNAQPRSPEAPTDLEAAGIPGGADISWTANGASAWRIFVDGTQVTTSETSTVTLDLVSGSHSIAVCATQTTVNGEYSSPKVLTSINVIPKLSQSINWNGISSIATASSGVNVAATTSSGLPVQYSTSTPAICSVSSLGAVTRNQFGECLIHFDQHGNADYYAVAQSYDIVVSFLRSQVISHNSLNSLALGSTARNIGGATTSGLTLSYSITTPAICSVTALTGVVTPKALGTCVVRISQAGNAEYATSSLDVSVSIVRPKASIVRSVKASVVSRKLTLTWAAPSNASTAGVTKYVVKYRVGATGVWKSVTRTTRSWTSLAFARGTKVYYSIYAVGPSGNGSAVTSYKVIS